MSSSARKRFGYFLGIALIAIAGTAVLRPKTPAPTPPPELLVRQLGHDYLRAVGDSVSMIPPVTVLTDGAYLLPLKQSVDYDQLVAVALTTFAHAGLPGEFALSLRDCATREEFLGALLKPSVPLPPGSYPACVGREQTERCGNVAVRFLPPASAPARWPWLVFALGLLLLGGRWRRQLSAPRSTVDHPPLAPDQPLPPAPANADIIAFTPDYLLDLQQLELRGPAGTTSLTFREAKLFGYLLRNANEVLPREQIQTAVWGDEGVLVGRSLDVFVSRLRKKLKSVPNVSIQTAHGVGYRLLLDEAAAAVR